MKKVFSFIVVCVIACLMAMFAGCGEADLNKLGLQMTTQMEELIKSDFYAKVMLGESYAGKRSDFIANDYDSPVKVFSISIPDTEAIVEKMLENNLDDWDSVKEEWDTLSETVKQQIFNRVSVQTIFSNINTLSNGSFDNIIIASSYTVIKTFENYSLKEDSAYLYLFETGMPIIVMFSSNDSGIQAVAQFLLVQKTITLSELRDIFTPFGCTVNNMN